MDDVVWATTLVPDAYTRTLASFLPADSWTVAMNIAHLIVYDESIAIPILASLVAGDDGTTLVRTDNEGWFYGDAVALSSEPMSALLARAGAAREKQIAIVESFAEDDWNRRWSPLFGSGLHGNAPHSPAWIANKTFQHTWEHGNAVFRAMLFSPRIDG